MRVWEEIIHTGIIGTDKKTVNAQILPEELLPLFEKLEKETQDKEDFFLGMTSVIYNYRRGSFLPQKETIAELPVCEAETKTQINTVQISSLQAALGDENDSLLFYWLLHCEKKNLVVSNELIPALLEIAERNKDLRPLILSCTGNRGKWMARFNPKWNFNNDLSEKEIFDHGKPDERKEALKSWRLKSPDEARAALMQTWSQEQAATKVELLEALEINLSKTDEEFLVSLLKEKSQKVKEVAIKLLKQIPDSFIVKDIWDFTKPLLVVKKTGGVLGMLGKETLELNLNFNIPEHFKSYGISHIDANKIYTEKEFTLDQLLGSIPPSYYEDHFQMKAEHILELFNKKPETEKFISSLASSTNNFKNAEWGILLFSKYKKLCHSVIKHFDRALQEEAALEMWGNQTNDFYEVLPGKEREWSAEFVSAILTKASNDPYRYNRGFYKHIIHHFPVSINMKIDSINVADEHKQSYWENLREEIKKMLAIKQQIIQSF